MTIKLKEPFWKVRMHPKDVASVISLTDSPEAGSTS